MSIIINHSHIPAGSGPLTLSIARPDGQGPFPAVVLVHEGIGVTQHLLELARRFAANGFVALVPDLYSHDRLRPGLSDQEVIRHLPLTRAADRAQAISELPVEERETARRVVAWFTARTTSTYLPDLQEAISWLRQQSEVEPASIAAIGFSLGGGLVARLAVDGAPIAAGVIFYGQLPRPDQVADGGIPLLGHFAADDAAVNEAIAPFAEALAAHGGRFEHHLHAGTTHGFFNELRPNHHAGAAAAAWIQTRDFLRRTLIRRPVAELSA